jgi:hypothetical protein
MLHTGKLKKLKNKQLIIKSLYKHTNKKVYTPPLFIGLCSPGLGFTENILRSTFSRVGGRPFVLYLTPKILARDVP